MTTVEQPQHLDALERANAVRLARADLKRRIKAGKCTVEEVLAPGGEVPLEALTMPVCELLTAQVRWGSRPAHASSSTAARSARGDR